MSLKERVDNLIKNPDKTGFLKLLPELETDSSLYLKLLFEFVNYLTLNKDYDQIIKVLELPLKKDFIQRREDRLEIANKLLVILLKIEDFYLLKSVLDTRKDLIVKENDFLMQQFYMAVCYEGLDELDLAISTLEGIKDNISNANLVNKYLKLSMLLLKKGSLDRSEEYYKLALFYDKTRKNTAFLLAECDLLITKKAYLKALEVYEDYYIKTKNKYRYLDRYINIQMALNQDAEAYSFYKKHFDVMTKVLSKQSRLAFYQAALNLVKRLGNYQEEALLESLIKEIEASFSVLYDNYSILLKLIDEFYNKTFIGEREVLRAVFKSLEETEIFSKMVYVKIDASMAKVYHYTKGLLLEKVIENSESDSNVYQDLLKNKFQNIYEKDQIKGFTNDKFIGDKTNTIFLEQLRDFEYLIFYYDNRDFFYARKTFALSGILIKKLFNDIDRFSSKVGLLETLLKAFDEEGYGVFSLRNNNMELLNQEAKNLLGIEEDYIGIERFQNLLVKNVYVDELLNKDKITLKISNKEVYSVDFKIYKDEFNLYLVGKKAFVKMKKQKYYSFEMLSDELIDGDTSIILFNLRSYHELFKDYSIKKYQDLLNSIYDSIRLSSRNYFQNLFLEGMDNIYLLIKTKDKRVISRIIDDLFSLVDQRIDLRASSMNLKTTIDEETILDLKYLVSVTSDEHRYLYDNKTFRSNREVARTIHLNVQKILSEENIKLGYQLIVNWQSGSFKYIYVDVLNRVLLGNKESLKRVLEANNLTSSWDSLIVGQLAKDVRLANVNAKYLVDISLKTLIEKDEFTNLKKKLSLKASSKSEIYYLVDYSEYLKYKPVLNYEQVIFKNVLDSTKLSDIDALKNIKRVIMTETELNKPGGKLLLSILKENSCEVIYDNQKSDLLKSFLINNNLNLVMGDSFKRYDQLKNIGKNED